MAPDAVRADESRRRPGVLKKKRVIGRAHRALRAATRNDHALIDRLLLPLDLGRPEHYRVFLTVHFAALSIVKPAWRAEDREDFEQMLSCLRADLESLGPAPTETPMVAAPHARRCAGLGIAYVVRGSRLGAAVLRRSVGATLSTSYLDFLPGLAWADFLQELESLAEDPDGIEEATRAARNTFNVFAAQIGREAGMISIPSFRSAIDSER